jgi:type VI secretion system protein VasD
MVSSSKCVFVIVLASLLLAMSSCGGSPPKPSISKATLVVAPDVNPDSGGRASPVVVRLYQLSQEGAFSNADFFALYDSEQETLGTTLVAREEFELKPGETREIEIKAPPETRFIGAIAAFRDIRNAKWRVVSATPPKGLTDKDIVKLSVVKSELQLSIGK